MRKTTNNQARNAWRLNPLALSVALVLGGVSAQALAVAPDAGQTIGNIATATYTDGSGVVRPATSNPVSTTVLQVASFDLTATQTKYVTLGGQVVYPHTLTNTGNGTDTFRLTVAQTTNAAGDVFDLTSLAIYADADGNGVPDNAVNLAGTDVSLNRNDVFTFVVVGYAPGSGLVDADDSIVTVTADSRVFQAVPADDPANISNVDTAILTADAVINVTKSANVTQGPTGTVIEYTITYTNVGNNTATGVTLTDAVPAGTTYQPGTGFWNGAVQTDLGDADVFSEAAGTITAAVGSVAPNVTGQIKFSVIVDATTAPGFLTNTANYSYDPDGGGVKPVVGPTPSNDVLFEVLQTRNVGANDDAVLETDLGNDDRVEQGPVLQGATVTFEDYIWNQGNGTDTFNITYANTSFPAGTSFTLYQADGLNVLQDTNGDFIPDTGPVAAGAGYKVVVKAVLPGSVSSGTNLDMVVTATSTATGVILVAGDQDDTVTNRVTSIIGSTVDLQNAGGLATGTGAANETVGGDGTTPFTTQTVNPGNNASFVLNVVNTSATADNYGFLADQDGVFGGVDDLPAGWAVTYYQDGGAGDCSSYGAAIVNTGTINAGATGTFCAVVSVPANAAPVTAQEVWFQTTSPLTGATDKKLDALSVNTVRDIQITTNNSNTVYPGGTVDYVHIITNNGNVLEGDAATEVVLSSANSTVGVNAWNTQLFYDADNNGVLSVLEASTPITDISAFVSNGAAGLAPGESIRIFARVQSNVNANPGDTDVATITLTTTGAVNGVAAPAAVLNTDTTSVIGGQVRLVKTQALDANCDGTEDGGGFVLTPLTAKPGACIIYRVVAENQGVSPATNVVVNDTTPTYTTLDTAGGRPTVTGAGNTITATPGNNNAGNVQATIPNLNGGASETIEIGVQIDN